MAEENSKNEIISDADKKMDALCDMIRDACAKMDEGSRRVDARMDALEENFRRADSARKDAEEEEAEKKAAADAAEEEEKAGAEKAAADAAEEGKGDPEPVAADAKKDAAEEEKGEPEADSHFMTRAEAAQLRAELAALSIRAPQMISDADRERFASIQEQADPVFQAFNDRAPSPLDGETPTQYKRRLGTKLQAHSPKWKDARLSAVSDEGMLDTVLADVYADSMAAARRGVDVPIGQLRMITRQSGGHTINEFEGGPEAWINQFAGNSQRATGDWRRPN